MKSTLSDEYHSAKNLFINRDFDGANEIIQKIQPLIKTDITDKTRLIPKLNVRYSIIVAVHQGFDDLKALLEDLEPYLFRQDYELIIINNTCQPAPNTIRSLIAEHSIIDIGFNYGCSGGRNIGAELAQGHYILFLDDDGRLAYGAVDALIDCIEKTIRSHVAEKSYQKMQQAFQADIIIKAPKSTCRLQMQKEYQFGTESSLSNTEGLTHYSPGMRVLHFAQKYIGINLYDHFYIRLMRLYNTTSQTMKKKIK